MIQESRIQANQSQLDGASLVIATPFSLKNVIYTNNWILFNTYFWFILTKTTGIRERQIIWREDESDGRRIE